MGQKEGRAAVPLSQGELGPRLAQRGLGRGLLPYQVTSSVHPSSRLATIDTGQKLGGEGPPFRQGGLGPHLTQSRLG